MSRYPVLSRFEVQVFKNKSTSDPAQVPASATIRFFRQGATTTGGEVYVAYADPEDPEPPPISNVSVLHLGDIRIGDVLQVDVNTADILNVVGIIDTNPDSPTIQVTNSSVIQGVVVYPGKRLLRKTANTIVYSNPTGPVPGAPVPVDFLQTNGTTGRASGYVAAYRFDYTVSGSGITTRLYTDAVGSYVLRG